MSDKAILYIHGLGGSHSESKQGAYFSMLSLKDCEISKALFISPVLDMENIILNMMARAGISENFLCERGEFITDSGKILLYKYLCFVRDNLIKWNAPTEILYSSDDNITPRN